MPNAESSNHLIATLLEQLKQAIDEIDSKRVPPNPNALVDYQKVVNLLSQHTRGFYNTVFSTIQTNVPLKTKSSYFFSSFSRILF